MNNRVKNKKNEKIDWKNKKINLLWNMWWWAWRKMRMNFAKKKKKKLEWRKIQNKSFCYEKTVKKLRNFLKNK